MTRRVAKREAKNTLVARLRNWRDNVLGTCQSYQIDPREWSSLPPQIRWAVDMGLDHLTTDEVYTFVLSLNPVPIPGETDEELDRRLYGYVDAIAKTRAVTE
jgi:hypothetical protein